MPAAGNSTFTLVLETSTPLASIALISPDGSVDERKFESDRHHNARLFEPLQELLAETRNGKIGLVLVGSGPGSYSGTRVGISAALGVAIAANCPAAAVPSILAVPAMWAGGPCLAIGDARRGTFWTAEMADHALICGPELCDAENFLPVMESAASRNVPVISFESPERFPLGDALVSRILPELPSATLLWRAWGLAPESSREHWLAETPQPIYLKPPHITPGKRAPLV